MKIIKIGDVDFKFICPNCKTEFEIETKELLSCNGHYFINCPLCNKILYMKDNFENANGVSVIKTIKKREELKNNEK